MPPRPSAQRKIIPPARSNPCVGLPGLCRTVKTASGRLFFAGVALRSRFLEYDRTTKQITVIGFPGHQLPHKGLSVNFILHFKTMD